MLTIFQNLQQDQVEAQAQLLLLDYYRLLTELIRWVHVVDLQHMQIYMVLDPHQV